MASSKRTQSEQKFRVDDIAKDEGQLEARARELTGKNVYFARENVQVNDLDSVDCETACAVLVQKDGGAGAVHVHGNKLDIIMTGPDQGEGWWLIVLEPGQSCRFYGQPSVQYFRPVA
jgi:hypothetical protein